MDLKERLKNYSSLIAEKREIEIRLEEIEGTELKAVNYDSVGTSCGISNATEKQAFKMVELKEKYNNLLKDKLIEINRIENAMGVLTEKERQLIEQRYINNSSWEVVAYKIDRTSRTCKSIEREALKKMDKILNLNI